MSEHRQLLLEWAEREGRSCLRITGWTEAELRELRDLDAGQLSRRLALYPSEALGACGDCPALPAVAGAFALHHEAVRFVPRFPFADGMSYSLRVDFGGSAQAVEIWAICRPSVASVPTAQVLSIHPTALTLPYNLLRMYVHFSASMSEGWAAQAIKICDAETGASLEGVFLRPEPELWDPQRRRLTLLLDPGRIKRGLVPNRELGYPLAEGMTVRVIVHAEFRDAKGQPLKAGAERHYRIGPALRSRIDPAAWRLTAPRAGSQAPLVVDFDRPLDHALLRNSLWVCDGEGNPISGAGEAYAADGGWRFTPSVPWIPGEQRLMVETRLEDVAGNTPVRVFDRDVSLPEDAPAQEGRTVIKFACSL